MVNCLTKEKGNILFLERAKGGGSLLSDYLEERDYSVKKTCLLMVEQIEEWGIDIVLFALEQGDAWGLKLINKIRSRFSQNELPIIILSNQNESEDIARAFCLGVNDYFSGTMTPGEILIRIQAHMMLKNEMVKQRDNPFGFKISGEGCHFSRINNTLMKENNFLFELKCKRFEITRREQDVIRLIVRGFINKEIGVDLNISCGTVRRHLENIYRKCGVQNRTELTALFLASDI